MLQIGKVEYYSDDARDVEKRSRRRHTLCENEVKKKPHLSKPNSRFAAVKSY